MGDITLSTAWACILGVCAAIVSIAKAWEIIRRFGKSDLRAALKKTNDQLDADARKIQELENAVKALKSANDITMQALLAMVNHEIDGNNIQGLKDMRNTLQDYLVHRIGI